MHIGTRKWKLSLELNQAAKYWLNLTLLKLIFCLDILRSFIFMSSVYRFATEIFDNAIINLKDKQKNKKHFILNFKTATH